jgi:tetratricopeptide (TPR) repeat protein
VKKGGQVLKTSYRHANLAVSGFLFGKKEFFETRLAFGQAVEHSGPDDFYTLRRGIRSHYDQLELPQLLSLIRMSGDDPKILRDCLPALWTELENASEPLRRELSRTVQRTWKNYFHLGEPRDLAFEFAMLLYGLGQYSAALELFQQSRQLYGEDPRTCWNMGLCYSALTQTENAAACFSQAFGLQADFRPRGDLQVKAEAP